jgi:ATP-dependent protease HslVU (ClpYQ) peptidase subunit
VTTIATDGRSMAGDTMMSAGNELVGFRQKVNRLPDGRLFGASGKSADISLFGKWMRGEIERPALDDDFSALVLAANGELFYLCNKLEPVEFIVPNSIGSGSEYALGAMLAGATPARAVEIACMRDKGSGGDITTLELNQ